MYVPCIHARTLHTTVSDGRDENMSAKRSPLLVQYVAKNLNYVHTFYHRRVLGEAGLDMV